MTAIPSSAIEALYATGHWLLEQSRFADAATVFQLMARAASNDERAWLALGACHEGIGQHGIAAELYTIGTVVAEPSARCKIARGRALRELGRSDDALAAFEGAVDLASESGDEEMAALARAEGTKS